MIPFKINVFDTEYTLEYRFFDGTEYGEVNYMNKSN